MYSRADLVQEIKTQFYKMEDRGGSVPKPWLVRSVMAYHPDIVGDDRDFALYCSEHHVTGEVERYFQSIKASETDLGQQFVLEGFEHIKKRYLVVRGQEIQAIRVAHMTPEELEAKAEELESFARGAFAHAAELRRLASNRRVA